MKVKLFFAWYDFWIGCYWDRKERRLYVCLLPCVVLRFEVLRSDLMLHEPLNAIHLMQNDLLPDNMIVCGRQTFGMLSRAFESISKLTPPAPAEHTREVKR